jgi:hypothetical protein
MTARNTITKATPKAQPSSGSGYSCACHALPQTVSRRGFLSGLSALGATSMLSACADLPGQTSKPHRVDIHHHIVPPNYAKELKNMTGASAPK